MIARYGPHTVAAYMGFVQDNAEACSAPSHWGTEGRIGARAAGWLPTWRRWRNPQYGSPSNAAAGEAVVDFTGSSCVLPSNFNAPTAVVHAAVLYVFPHTDRRRHSAERRLPCADPHHRAGAVDASAGLRLPPWWRAMWRPASISSMRFIKR